MTDRHLEIAAAFLFDKDATVMSISRKFSMTQSLVSYILSQLNVDIEPIKRHRRKKARAKIRFLHSLGWSHDRIAKETNYSERSVRHVVSGEWA